MKLRPMSGCACARIGLAAAVLALAVSPTALAFAEKPKPDALWEAFPLEPTPERASTPAPPRASPLLPPSTGRAEATTVAQPSEASGPGIMVVAFAATLLLLFATVGVFSGRRFYLGKRHRRTTVPLWQGAALPLTSDHERQRHGSGIRTSSAPVGHGRRAGGTDFLAPLYQWVEVDKPPADRSCSHPSLGSEIRTLVHRVRRAVWTENIVAVIVGGAVAVVVATLVVYLLGSGRL